MEEIIEKEDLSGQMSSLSSMRVEAHKALEKKMGEAADQLKRMMSGVLEGKSQHAEVAL